MPAQKKVNKFRRTVKKLKSKRRPAIQKPVPLQTEEVISNPESLPVTSTIDSGTPIEETAPVAEERSPEKVMEESQGEGEKLETNQTIDTIAPAKSEAVDLGDVGESGKNLLVKILLLFFVFIIGLTAGGATMYFFKFRKGPAAFKNSKTTGTIPSEEVSTTVTPSDDSVETDKYEIKVLNGSLVKGAAGKLKVNLESEGFKVSSFGNADSSVFKETVIKAKKGTDENYLEKLKTFLSKTYVLAENQELADSEKSDVIVILGSELSL